MVIAYWHGWNIHLEKGLKQDQKFGKVYLNYFMFWSEGIPSGLVTYLSTAQAIISHMWTYTDIDNKHWNSGFHSGSYLPMIGINIVESPNVTSG